MVCDFWLQSWLRHASDCIVCIQCRIEGVGSKEAPRESWISEPTGLMSSLPPILSVYTYSVIAMHALWHQSECPEDDSPVSKASHPSSVGAWTRVAYETNLNERAENPEKQDGGHHSAVSGSPTQRSEEAERESGLYKREFVGVINNRAQRKARGCSLIRKTPCRWALTSGAGTRSCRSARHRPAPCGPSLSARPCP